jgi:hypothetical protein
MGSSGFLPPCKSDEGEEVPSHDSGSKMILNTFSYTIFSDDYALKKYSRHLWRKCG